MPYQAIELIDPANNTPFKSKRVVNEVDTRTDTSAERSAGPQRRMVRIKGQMPQGNQIKQANASLAGQSLLEQKLSSIAHPRNLSPRPAVSARLSLELYNDGEATTMRTASRNISPGDTSRDIGFENSSRDTSVSSNTNTSSSESEDIPRPPKRAKLGVATLKSRRPGLEASKTALKKEGIAYRKEIKQLKATLGKKEAALITTTEDLNMQRVRYGALKNSYESTRKLESATSRLTMENTNLTGQIDRLTSEIDDLKPDDRRFKSAVSNNNKLTSENNNLKLEQDRLKLENDKLKSTASKTMLSIVEEEVKGQLQGLRTQWASMSAPPKTADSGVHAGVQTEDDGTAATITGLKAKLAKTIDVARENMMHLVNARDRIQHSHTLEERTIGDLVAVLGELGELEN